ncbi:MAG: 4-hydroxy-tetrahydrodipicolinate reductase [Planctomycetota bacterium]|jgi:4-hydroxy-tetrahydrodipicolinate reductase|nr:4-hydroxy-tetrahydrodipicolinate reductase [Planctomycetota bacterium]
MTTPIDLAILGAAGRMGRRLLALSDADPAFRLVQAVERPGFPDLGQDINARQQLAPQATGVKWSDRLQPGAVVAIDFSAPESVAVNAVLAAAAGTRLVVGTTGLGEAELSALRQAATRTAVLLSPNYSLGVNLLFRLVAEAARVLSSDYNIEIVEAHHRHKCDAPSGTALAIARQVAAVRGLDPEKDLTHGRQGRTGEREADEIGMHALRLGAFPGDHRVYFANDYECLEISHRAQSGEVFAAGALAAARWIIDRPAGFYGMADILGDGKKPG